MEIGQNRDVEDSQIVVRGYADNLSLADLAGRKTDGHLISSLHDMIVGDHMPGSVPDKARARLNTGSAFQLAGWCGLADDLYNRRGIFSEDLERGFFIVGQRSARLD